MLNHIVIMGRLTADPELRRTTSGLAVASFTLAVDRDFSSNKETGEKETDFINVVAWRNTAEFVSKYFAKGRTMAVSGRLQIRKWTDKDGNKRSSAEVVADNCYFGDSKQGGGSSGGFDDGGSSGGGSQKSFVGGNSASAQSSYKSGYGSASDFSILEEDDSSLPF